MINIARLPKLTQEEKNLLHDIELAISVLEENEAKEKKNINYHSYHDENSDLVKLMNLRLSLLHDAHRRGITEIAAEGGEKAVLEAYKTEVTDFLVGVHKQSNGASKAVNAYSTIYYPFMRFDDNFENCYFSPDQTFDWIKINFPSYFYIFSNDLGMLEKFKLAAYEVFGTLPFVREQGQPLHITEKDESDIQRLIQQAKTEEKGKPTEIKSENIILPQTTTLLLDKLTKNALTMQAPQNKQNSMRIDLNKEGTDRVVIMLENLEADVNLSYVDQVALEAVISLIEKGNTFIPYSSIHKVMTGGKRPTQADKEAIQRSIKKLRTTFLNANFKNPESIKGTLAKLKKYQGYILNADEMTLIVKGKETQGIRIIERPWFYLWAKESRQIQRIPLSLLSVNVGRIKGGEIIINYLLRRIEIMKRTSAKPTKKASSNKILLSTIIEKTSDTEYKGQLLLKRRANVVKIVKKALDQWCTEGHIQGYQIEKEGNAVRAFEITLKDC